MNNPGSELRNINHESNPLVTNCAVAIMSAGVQPFTHAATSADDNLGTGQDGIFQLATKFKVSCGAVSKRG